MRIAQKYRLAKSELLARWTLEDIFDAAEYLDIQSAQEEEYMKQVEEERNKK